MLTSPRNVVDVELSEVVGADPSTRAVKACNAPRQFVGYSLLVDKALMVLPGSRRLATQSQTVARPSVLLTH